MSRVRKLEFDIRRLSDAGRAYLRRGFCVEENPNHLWASEYALLDMLYDSGNGPDLEGIPEEVWKTLGLPREDRAEIEALWAENPDNEVEWC